jgi:hypothetical protein
MSILITVLKWASGYKMAHIQRGRTARLATVPEWDRASALSFKTGSQKVRITAQSPFAHLLITFWSFAKEAPGPTFILVSSIGRFREAFEAREAHLTAAKDASAVKPGNFELGRSCLVLMSD